jgi:hypothetical protein
MGSTFRDVNTDIGDAVSMSTSTALPSNSQISGGRNGQLEENMNGPAAWSVSTGINDIEANGGIHDHVRQRGSLFLERQASKSSGGSAHVDLPPDSSPPRRAGQFKARHIQMMGIGLALGFPLIIRWFDRSWHAISVRQSI